MVWLPRGGGGGLLFISFSSFLWVTWDDMLRLGQTRPDQTRKDKTCVDICRAFCVLLEGREEGRRQGELLV